MLIFTQMAGMKMKLTHCLFAAVLAVPGCFCASALAVVTGQYPLNGNASDTSGFNRNGTIAGTPTNAAGLYQNSNGALDFNGADQSIQLPDNTDFIRNAPGATLMAWVRPDVSDAGAHTILVVNNADATQNGGLGAARANLQINAGTFRLLGRQADTGGSTTLTGGTPTLGTTYFVAGVFEYATSALRLYIDGQPVANSTVAAWTANVPDTANPVSRIGANFNGTAEFFNGVIDGARIFNTALSASEILSLYNAETFPPPLAGDTDGDGVVEPEDLTPIRNNWRMTGKTRLEGNLSGDQAGLVDFVDFRQWKTAFVGGGGSLDGIDLGFAAVPEPSAILLMLISAAVSVGRRSRRG